MTAQLDFTHTSTQTMHHGDCLDIMKTMEDNSIDFICTDPPYGLHFMGKTWDSSTPNIDIWKEAVRICKPGSMLAAFGGSRTHHHLMLALENAGFEIRDVIMWLYGSGFPKSHNHFGLPGYGTALKPAYEPIILAMKPLDGTYAQNAQKWGLAGINIDDNRIEIKQNDDIYAKNPHTTHKDIKSYGGGLSISEYKIPKGRWPANLILDEEAADMLDQTTDNASRFFYCAKASSAERNKGLEGLPIKQTIGGGGTNNTEDDVCGKYGSIKAPQHNFHPTVKPIALMKYIIKLLAPPNSPICLDPFMGSGTTGIACKQLDINFIGIEKEEEYFNIAKARMQNG